MQACTTLFQVSLDHLRRATALAPPDRADELLALTLRTFNHSVGARVTAHLRGYDSLLLHQVREANSADRMRLSRDVHDYLGNSLALTLRHLELYVGEELDGAWTPRLARVHDSVQEALSYTRTLVNGLRMRIPAAGLESSLREFAETVGRPPTRTEIRVCGDESWISPELRQDVMVALRECLRNAFTHARAGRIGLWVDIAPDVITATVEDDGAGFDPARTAGGNGLTSVRERVGLHGGTATWHSRPGVGTQVVLRVPQRRAPGPADPGPAAADPVGRDPAEGWAPDVPRRPGRGGAEMPG
ncbi:sensor histidine kinase [Streptomyces pactum]|nr:ATP-binding protein [Streptomyces pactum]